MKRELKLFLTDIMNAIELIEESTKDLKKREFLKDRDKQDATMRRLEVIGEATKNLPESFRKKYPEIEWSDIAKFRDKIMHAYFGVDLGIVWNVIKKDLPELKQKIEGILEEME